MTSDTSEADIRARYIGDARLHLEAARELRDHLDTVETVTVQLIDAIAEGVPLIDVLPRVGVSERRPALSESIRNFERIRHRARLRLIVVALNEGMTVHDIATEWGITRQLAARYVKEIAELDATPPPG